MGVNEPFLRKVFIPRQQRTQEYYESRINQINEEIEEEIMKPFLSSGHAFVCFDSIESAEICMKKF